jgi:hypothetical protein
MARSFGVISIISGTTTAVADIVAESVNKAVSVETATARDESGKVTDMKAYSKTTTYTINGLLKERKEITSTPYSVNLPQAPGMYILYIYYKGEVIPKRVIVR